MAFLKKKTQPQIDKKLERLVEALGGTDGQDGKTPILGEDYFTEEEKVQFKKEVTPVKGVDYFDGKDGKDSKVPGPKGDKGDTGERGSDGSPDTPEQIAEKINLLDGALEISTIKDLETRLSERKGFFGGTISSKRIKVLINGVEQNEALGSINLVGSASHVGQDYTFSGGSGSSPLTTKGDVYTYSTMDARLPVGTDGQGLIADSSQATGLRWGTVAGSIVYQTPIPFLLEAGVTRYCAPAGMNLYMAELKSKTPQVVSGTYSLVKVNVVSNTLSGACTVTLRVNGASSAVTVSVPSGTGIFTSTGTVAVAVDDLVNFEVVTDAGTGSVEIQSIISKVI